MGGWIAPPSAKDDEMPPVTRGAACGCLGDVSPRVPKTEARGQGREEGFEGGGRVVWR